MAVLSRVLTDIWLSGNLFVKRYNQKKSPFASLQKVTFCMVD